MQDIDTTVVDGEEGLSEFLEPLSTIEERLYNVLEGHMSGRALAHSVEWISKGLDWLNSKIAESEYGSFGYELRLGSLSVSGVDAQNGKLLMSISYLYYRNDEVCLCSDTGVPYSVDANYFIDCNTGLVEFLN